MPQETIAERRVRAGSPTAELRCERHLHGVLDGPIYAVRCGRHRLPVFHRWDTRTTPWTPLPDLPVDPADRSEMDGDSP